MSEIAAALHEINRNLEGAEDAAQSVFIRHLDPLLMLLFDDVDHLIGRSLDHVEATQMIPLE